MVDANSLNSLARARALIGANASNVNSLNSLARARSLIGANASNANQIGALDQYIKNPATVYNNASSRNALNSLLRQNVIPEGRQMYRALTPEDFEGIKKAQAANKLWVPNKPLSVAGSTDLDLLGASNARRLLFAPGETGGAEDAFGQGRNAASARRGTFVNSQFNRGPGDTPTLATIYNRSNIPGLENVNDLSNVKSTFNQEGLIGDKVGYRVQDFVEPEPRPKGFLNPRQQQDFNQNRMQGRVNLMASPLRALGPIGFLMDVINSSAMIDKGVNPVTGAAPQGYNLR